MSRPAVSLATLIMLADASQGALPTRNVLPSLYRKRSFRGRIAIQTMAHGDPLPSAAGVWISPVSTVTEDRTLLNREITALNTARNRAIRLTYRRGLPSLREYGVTLVSGDVETLRAYMLDCPKTPEDNARWLAMGEDDSTDLHTLETGRNLWESMMGEGGTESGGSVDGDSGFAVKDVR